jgi:hypothetical protein
MANPYRAFRQLERKIFRGVPEQPEPISQRDINAHVAERITGRSQRGGGVPNSAIENAKLIATVIFNFDSQEVFVERSTPAIAIEPVSHPEEASR